MISIAKISLYQLPQYIELSYVGDEDLFNKYHIAPYDLKGCVVSTLLMIKEMSLARKLDYYKVMLDKTPIGYFVTGQDDIYSFGINIKYRKKEILVEWFEHVKKILPEQFTCMLYNNNTRAIEFLVKNGFRIVEDSINDNVTVLLYNKKYLKEKKLEISKI